MMMLLISLYATTAAYRLINDFRSKTSGSQYDTFETAPPFFFAGCRLLIFVFIPGHCIPLLMILLSVQDHCICLLRQECAYLLTQDLVS